MSSITIDEVKEKKLRLVEALRAELYGFYRETGCVIDRVDVINNRILPMLICG